jgi:hypothetical protein
MLWRKGNAAILPCAGITLIRFTGLISDRRARRVQSSQQAKHPGNQPADWQAMKTSTFS